MAHPVFRILLHTQRDLSGHIEHDGHKESERLAASRFRLHEHVLFLQNEKNSRRLNGGGGGNAACERDEHRLLENRRTVLKWLRNAVIVKGGEFLVSVLLSIVRSYGVFVCILILRHDKSEVSTSVMGQQTHNKSSGPLNTGASVGAGTFTAASCLVTGSSTAGFSS